MKHFFAILGLGLALAVAFNGAARSDREARSDFLTIYGDYAP